MDIIAFNIEYADKKVLEKLLDWAYDWVVAEQQYSDDILRAKDLSQYVLYPASNRVSLVPVAPDRFRRVAATALSMLLMVDLLCLPSGLSTGR